MDILPHHDMLFSLINASVLPAWALLIFAPRWTWTDRLIHSGLYPVILGLAYTGFLICALVFGTASEPVSFTSIAGVSAIFSHPYGVLTGWVHYLVFDLFVGMWEARDARRRGIRHIWLVPCLLLTFMAGPLGLLIYFVIRRKMSIDPASA